MIEYSYILYNIIEFSSQKSRGKKAMTWATNGFQPSGAWGSALQQSAEEDL